MKNLLNFIYKPLHLDHFTLGLVSQLPNWSRKFEIVSLYRYEDNCGVYWPFESDRNVPVECNSDESHTPGTFCVKVTRQGPRGFICKQITHYIDYVLTN